MYLLIRVWETAGKNIRPMKLTLMLWEFRLLAHRHSGNLFPARSEHHEPLLELHFITSPSNNNASGSAYLPGIRRIVEERFFLSTWSPDGRADTNCRICCALYWWNSGGYGCFRIAMYLMPETANELSWIFLILTGISVVLGAFGVLYKPTWSTLMPTRRLVTADSCCLPSVDEPAANTGAVLQMLICGLTLTALFFAPDPRHDLQSYTCAWRVRQRLLYGRTDERNP